MQQPQYYSQQQTFVQPWQHQQNSHYHDNKTIPAATVQPQNSDYYGTNDGQNFSDQSAPWKPGFWRRLPYLSMLSLLATLVCIVAALYVLLASDGMPIDKWGYGVAPAVYLAIISVITNVFLSFALVNGLVISFWRMALKGGCTLTELNRNWQNGTSAFNALTAGFRSGGRLTALACLFTIVGLLRGPLNQRASNVRPNVAFGTKGSVQLNVAQILPDGYTGVNVMSRAKVVDTARLTPTFNSVMQDYASLLNMKLDHAPCGDSCTTTVKGFGFRSSCSVTEYTISMPTAGATPVVFLASTVLYSVDNQTVTPGQPGWSDTGLAINTTSFLNVTASKTSNSSLGTFSYRTHLCYLEPGGVSYDIELTNGTVLLRNTSSDDYFNKTALLSPTPVGGFTTIGGFQYAMSYLYDSTSTLSMTGVTMSVALKGALANEMLIYDANVTSGYYTYRDPMPIMLDSLREIAFRASLRAGVDNTTITNAAQSVPYIGQGSQTIYITNRRYMALAAAVSLLSFFAVLSTFYGWWELGREMSMSPLEIAKAFDAPLLRSVGSNIPVKKMRSELLATRVQYGENPKNGLPWNGPAGDQRGKSGTLRFGEHSRKPQTGQPFSS